MRNQERILYYDMLNICACIAVIAIHHNGIAHTFSNSWTWKTALIAEVIFYWCVPVFLMLTGATLMPYRNKYNTKEFFRRRFVRTLIPFVAWSLILLFVKELLGKSILETFSVQEIISAVLNYKIEGVYWFFPLLFSIYFLMPVLSLLSLDEYRNTLKYTIVIMLILQSTLPFLSALLGIQWNSDFSLSWNSCLVYVLLGYYLSTEEKLPLGKLVLIGILGCIIRYVCIYKLSMRDGTINKLFFTYGCLPAVMLSVSVFSVFKAVDWKKIFQKIHLREEVIADIASCSLGVYLIHKSVMWVELKVLGGSLDNTSIIWRTIFIIITYLISLILVKLIKYIPVVKKIVP